MQIFGALEASEIFSVPELVDSYSSLKPTTYFSHTKFSFQLGSTYARELEKHKQLQRE